MARRRTLLWSLVALVSAGAAGEGAPAHADPLPPALAVAARAYDDGQVRGDKAALERLLADDYVLVNSRGEVESKSQLIADYTSPDYRLDPYTVTEKVEKVFGRGAILGGRITLRGISGGARFSADLRFMDVWRNTSGGWRVVYTQVTRAPARVSAK